MNKSQLNGFAMYLAVQAFLLNSAAALAAITVLAAKLTKLSAFLERLRELTRVQFEPLQGKTVVRQETLDQTSDLTLEVAGAVLSYAKDVQHAELGAKMDITRWGLQRLRQAERTAFMQNVHDAAATVIADLTPYGVTPERLAEFQTSIHEANHAVNEPRRVLSDRKVATAEIIDLTQQIDALLEDEIDPLLLPLRRTNPVLWKRYQEAREVFDSPGVRHREQPAADATATATGITTPATTTTLAAAA
jgi:hypothetical protein